MYCQAPANTVAVTNTEKYKPSLTQPTANQVKISITIPIVSESGTAEDHQKNFPKLNISPIHLLPPSLEQSGVMHKMNTLSNSFNCLTASTKESDSAQSPIKKYPMSSSDSNLQSSSSRNIFNFSNDLFLNPIENICSSRKPPLSPYRARSPSPFPSSLDTPPSSPLTPLGILYNLPSFMLTPILHWLYTESLMPDMDEETCEKLINFAETQPPLIKMMDPCKRYLKLIRLKNCKLSIWFKFFLKPWQHIFFSSCFRCHNGYA